MFGGINALFTGLALAGAIYTILLQRHELELQREELRLTRKQLHASAESIKPRLGGFRHRYLPRQDLRSWDMVSARPLKHRVATGPEWPPYTSCSVPLRVDEIPVVGLRPVNGLTLWAE